MSDESGGPLSSEDLRASAAHGLRWSAISRPTIEVIQLGGLVVLARLIVPAEFGRYAIAAIAAEIANLLVAGGLATALVQRKSLDRRHLQSGLAIGLLAGAALTALVLAAATLVVAPVFGARTAFFVRLIAPLCLLEAVTAVPIATLRRRLAFRRLSMIEMTTNAVRVLVAIALAVAGLRGESLVLGMLAASLTGAVLAWASAPAPWPRLYRTAAREILSVAVPISLATLSWVGFGNVDYAIIGARLGPVWTGYYYRAFTVGVEYQNKIAAVMVQVGFPVLARTADEDELARLYRQMVRLLTIVLFPLLVLLAVMAPVFVPFLFGARWASSVAPMQILALGGAAAIIFKAVEAVFMATGRARVLLGNGWTQFAVYGMTIFAVAPYGITAVAIAAAAVHVLFAVIAYALMLRGTGVNPLRRLWSDVAPATVSCAALAAVAVPVGMAMTAAKAPAIVWLPVVGAAALPPYLLVLRSAFPETWRSQCAALGLILPGNGRLGGVKRRLAAAATVN